MRILIDTNIVIDVLEKREEFFDNSYAIMNLAATKGKFEAFIPAGGIADIYYIIRKSGRSAQLTKDAIASLLQLINICNTDSVDIFSALLSPISDFEDAIVTATAKREKVEFIITRNESDFAESPVPPISPTEFLLRYN